ncbi:uncharacterized protein JN550_013105 [Neoarthrinium moseri]|uniref:uncharacterized protein n=1 Tax=Neoarthrinium moseri TaxID=1658444 RepID=UPI001FDCEADD|nr:uncharacterized protein JN550_013105 [Neoarthrinium moseri]KAI1857769.1 hypothetical protein JN550_013105 [Neoarthrinium moseri]
MEIDAQAQSPFFRLAAEVREMVLTHYFTLDQLEERVIQSDWCAGMHKSGPLHSPSNAKATALLQVCRRLRMEASPLVLGTVIMRFGNDTHALSTKFSSASGHYNGSRGIHTSGVSLLATMPSAMNLQAPHMKTFYIEYDLRFNHSYDFYELVSSIFHPYGMPLMQGLEKLELHIAPLWWGSQLDGGHVRGTVSNWERGKVINTVNFPLPDFLRLLKQMPKLKTLVINADVFQKPLIQSLSTTLEGSGITVIEYGRKAVMMGGRLLVKQGPQAMNALGVGQFDQWTETAPTTLAACLSDMWSLLP